MWIHINLTSSENVNVSIRMCISFRALKENMRIQGVLLQNPHTHTQKCFTVAGMMQSLGNSSGSCQLSSYCKQWSRSSVAPHPHLSRPFSWTLLHIPFLICFHSISIKLQSQEMAWNHFILMSEEWKQRKALAFLRLAGRVASEHCVFLDIIAIS